MMYSPDANAIEKHIAIKNEKTPITHIRKKCACGQVVTAKQLVQYGKCDKCVRTGCALSGGEHA